MIVFCSVTIKVHATSSILEFVIQGVTSEIGVSFWVLSLINKIRVEFRGKFKDYFIRNRKKNSRTGNLKIPVATRRREMETRKRKGHAIRV